MNMYLKKGLSLILSTSMILPFTTGISTNADTIDYVAFGDSIAYGYGLKDKNDGCISLVGQYLNTEVSNYAITGLDSTELIEMFDTGEYDEAISNADLITLTIGSNDILTPFIEIVLDTLEIDKNSINEDNFDTFLNDWNDSTDIFKKIIDIAKLNEVLTDNQTLNEACENFKENNFPTIINDIKELNPDCEIIVTNFYNPYYEVNISNMLDLGTLSDTYIQKLNSALDTSSPDYKVADIYDSFNTTGLTNVNVSILNLDPHPNIDGHKVIGDTIIQTIKEYTNLGVNTENSESSEILGDINKDGFVNVLDLLLIKKRVLNTLTTEEINGLNFDINNDENINILDLLTLKKIVLKVS